MGKLSQNINFLHWIFWTLYFLPKNFKISAACTTWHIPMALVKSVKKPSSAFSNLVNTCLLLLLDHSFSVYSFVCHDGNSDLLKYIICFSICIWHKHLGSSHPPALIFLNFYSFSFYSNESCLWNDDKRNMIHRDHVRVEVKLVSGAQLELNFELA